MTRPHSPHPPSTAAETAETIWHDIDAICPRCLTRHPDTWKRFFGLTIISETCTHCGLVFEVEIVTETVSEIGSRECRDDDAGVLSGPSGADGGEERL